MAARIRPRDAKVDALAEQGCLNPHPEQVQDPAFVADDFFDARDVVQVKYEMVRRVRVDRQPVSHTAAAFGYSRPSFYEAQAAVERGGLAALVPKKRGPRHAHKLSAEVVAFLLELRDAEPTLRTVDLAQRVQERFGRKVHARSVERALARVEKKQP